MIHHKTKKRPDLIATLVLFIAAGVLVTELLKPSTPNDISMYDASGSSGYSLTLR